MQLNFRQGVARHQKDVNGNPVFLQRSGASGQFFIDLVVQPDPTIIVFAHKSATYIVEEVKTVAQAWGPLIGSNTKYLYWDVNLLTGALTRGFTVYPALYTSAPSPNPQPDQHWFDTNANQMRVWNGAKWVDKLRVFAGHVTSGSIIHPTVIGTQAGLVGPTEGGSIILDSLGNPLRQSDGSFVTTTTWLNVMNLGTTTVRLEEPIMSGMADEELPKYSLVQLRPGRRLVLARSTDYTSRISGIITNSMYESEVGIVITDGVVKNDQWNFSPASINRPLFCGSTGQVTLAPPQTGIIQQIGFVYDTQSIYMDIKQPVVLDSPDQLPTPPGPAPIGIPIANFSAVPLSGVAPLAVMFTDASVDGESVSWDFTNDGYYDSTDASPTYTYSTPGTYTVRQVVSNSFGSDDQIKINYINVLAPVTSPLNTNLGLSFGAPSQVTAGSAFNFQVITSNDGFLTATNVARRVTIRTSDGSAITVVASPAGSTVALNGDMTVITLPVVTITSGPPPLVSLIKIQTASTARSIQLDGVTYSGETDANLLDNAASLTITVRP